MQIRKVRLSLLLIQAFLVVLLSAVGIRAHEIRPSIADFSIDDGRYEIRVQTNLEAMIAGIGSEHTDTDESEKSGIYDELRALPPEALASRFEAYEDVFKSLFKPKFGDKSVEAETVTAEIPPVGDTDIARDSVVIIRGAIPVGVSSFTWQWPKAFGASVIRMPPAQGESEGYSAYLSAGETSEAIAIVNAAPQDVWQIIWNYLLIGFEHIIPKGLDHIFFVVGLYLLSTKLSTLLWQVTAFTLAHTVTLALGILGYVTISPAIVEPLIALSIAYVAIENVMTDKLHRWRPVIVFLFGLLHGLGFAGVLGEIGLSQAHFVAGLISFNVGVELGQLAVIAVCFVGFGYWFGDKPWYRRMIAIPLSIFIAVIALWWVYERVIPVA